MPGMGLLAFALFATFAGLVLVSMACMNRLERHLRERHPEAHDALGMAEQWWRRRRQDREYSRLMAFLFRGEFRALRDRRVTELAKFMRVVTVVQVAVFISFVVLILMTEEDEPEPEPAAVASVAAPPQVQDASPATAYDHYLATIEREPDNFSAHVSLDRILSRQRRWDELLEMWGRYLERNPRDADAWHERAGTNYWKGDLEAARSDAARACELGKERACNLAQRLKGE